ncbi:flagellar biosynthesis anti-sigma factor FlgM [Ferroacidibacillus organovorans]|uniref:flagellar biosynthesis anti-sigma factor FlgM n=1 Tax=Ferroacidibacillus organovorans TaxID=1765683 RepID=UPI0009EB6BCF|nr:flagellar biosynthesis anti-sigma factor FlgM [Ferroacidibacillus organovorans]
MNIQPTEPKQPKVDAAERQKMIQDLKAKVQMGTYSVNLENLAKAAIQKGILT